MKSLNYACITEFGYYDFVFIANAKKYTQEQTLDLFLNEYKRVFENADLGYRKPTVDDVNQRMCAPVEDGYRIDPEDTKKAFPIWVIEVEAPED